MKTLSDRQSPSKVRLTVEATPEEVAPALERAVKSLAGTVKIPGFRQGHAPRKVLESRVGRDALREATIREAVPEIVAKAMETEDLRPVAAPSVEVTTYDLDADLIVEAVVEVRPDIELPPLDGFVATRPSAIASDAEIDEQIERLRDRFASLEAVSRPAQEGDFALIDITGSVHDAKVEQLSSTDELYQVGSGFPVPELDGQLTGEGAGAILKFNATLPEGVGGDQAGKEITFQVLLKEVRRKVLPPLDDSLATTVSEFETLDALRADIAERIAEVKREQGEADIRNQLLEALIDEVDLEPPEALVGEEFNYRAQRLSEQIGAAGMTLQDYFDRSGQDQEKVEEELRNQADRNVRAQLILEEIGRREEFKVSEDELREEVRRHAEALRQDPADLAKQLNEGGRILALAGDIIRRKALDFLVERADIKEEDAPDAEGDEPSVPEASSTD